MIITDFLLDQKILFAAGRHEIMIIIQGFTPINNDNSIKVDKAHFYDLGSNNFFKSIAKTDLTRLKQVLNNLQFWRRRPKKSDETCRLINQFLEQIQTFFTKHMSIENSLMAALSTMDRSDSFSKAVNNIKTIVVFTVEPVIPSITRRHIADKCPHFMNRSTFSTWDLQRAISENNGSFILMLLKV